MSEFDVQLWGLHHNLIAEKARLVLIPHQNTISSAVSLLMRVPFIPDVAEVLFFVTWRKDIRKYLRCLAAVYVLTLSTVDIKSLGNCAH